MIFTHLSLFQDKRIFLKTTLTLKIVVFMLCISIASQTSAELLFHDDFEKDKVGAEPSKWEVGHDGKTIAKVVADPKKASNKVLLTADNHLTTHGTMSAVLSMLSATRAGTITSLNGT